jgi:hypothetical protein
MRSQDHIYTLSILNNWCKQGVTALYRHLRSLYGNGYFMSNCVNGTDESTWAQSADGNFKELICLEMVILLQLHFLQV